MDRIFFLLLSLSALYIAESSEVFINISAFAVSRQHPGYCFHFGNWHLTITHVNHLNVISWDAPPVISCCLGLLLFQLRHLPSLNTSPNWRLPKEEGKNQSRLVSYSEESNSLQMISLQPKIFAVVLQIRSLTASGDYFSLFCVVHCLLRYSF